VCIAQNGRADPVDTGTHGIEVGGFAVHSSGKRVVINATIDNLLKGAATQALQVS